MKVLKITIALVSLLLLIIVCRVALVYYRGFNPKYSLGVDTPAGLREVVIVLNPKGTATFGIGGGLAMDANPPWPIPNTLEVHFQDESKNHFSAKIPTGATAGFSGELVVHVTKKTDNYYAFLTRTDKAKHTTQTPDVIVLKE